MATEIWTYQDAVEHLADQFNAKRSNELLRSMRRAVQKAYRDLSNLHRWSYYDRRYILHTNAKQTDGTVVYDHTGGSNERELTLTGATWPSDAALGRVIIAGKHYDIDRRISTTVATLKENSNPGADVASTTYTFYQHAYLLPTDFKTLLHVIDTDREEDLMQVTVSRNQRESIYAFDTPDTPWTCTVTGTGDTVGDLYLIFSPPPSSSVKYDVLYTAAPRPLQIEQYNTGTVTVASGSTSLSSAGGATFPEEVVGSYIRFSADGTTLPTSSIGDLAGNDNLYYAQRKIVERTDANNLVLDSSMSDTLTAVKYVISDPLDIESKSMLTAFLRMAEYEYARHRGIKAEDRPSKQDMYEAITLAKEADRRMPNLTAPRAYDPFRRPTITQD